MREAVSGRHRSSKNPVRFSTGFVLSFVAIIIVTALIIWWAHIAFRTEEEPEHCIKGELVIPVAEQVPGVARAALDQYQQGEPRLRDYCLKAEIVPRLSQAAAYVAVDSPVATAAITAAGRERSADQASVAIANRQTGIATRGELPVDDTIRYLGADEPDAAASVAQLRYPDDLGAAENELKASANTGVEQALEEAATTIATSEDAIPEGYAFHPLPGGQITYSFIPLNPRDSSGQTEEEQRAINQMARAFHDKHYVTAPRVPAAPLYRALGVQIDDPNARSVQATDTVYLIERSDAMSGHREALTAAVSDAAGRFGEHPFSLWSYADTAQEELPFGDSDVAEKLHELSYGGAAHTRASLIATLRAAGAHAAETNTPTRVVILSTGSTEGDMSDEDFAIQLDDVLSEFKISYALVHVGTAVPADKAQALRAEISLPADDEGLAKTVLQASGIDDI